MFLYTHYKRGHGFINTQGFHQLGPDTTQWIFKTIQDNIISDKRNYGDVFGSSTELEKRLAARKELTVEEINDVLRAYDNWSGRVTEPALYHKIEEKVLIKEVK